VVQKTPTDYFLNNSVKSEQQIIFGIRNPEKIPQQNVTNLSTSPVKCSYCTVKKSKQSNFAEISHLEHSQRQMDKLD